MSDPRYPYSRGFARRRRRAAAAAPRYSDFEVDLIAARYAAAPPPPPYPSSADASAFDSHVGAFDSLVGAFDSPVGAFDSHFGAFDSHAGAGDPREVRAAISLFRLCKSFPLCVHRQCCCILADAWAGLGNLFLFLFVVTVVYGRMAAC
ncbi:hypothetical protein PVAP13_5NG333601 [Panicum virgatum]|uniref:Uncharacterized protein n=1 Tax=Panicum virgatum TaxID=38727 RepID=A0A8T0RZV0_PANVG|nr:hypothetical protein PVAP13_5NG333601 [Panicum virgatum]